MCLIALNQTTNELDIEAVIRGHINNAHAFGILGQCKETGKAIISKVVGYNPWQLRKELIRISGLSSTIAVHLRLQTHGKNDVRNCHPYKVQFKDGRRYFIMHNGIFSDYGTKEDSDTMDFVRKIMIPLLRTPNALDKFHIRELIETFCKRNLSKLVILDETRGVWHIMNETAGVQEGDIWYSNTGFRQTTYAPYRNGGYNHNKTTYYAPLNKDANAPSCAAKSNLPATTPPVAGSPYLGGYDDHEYDAYWDKWDRADAERFKGGKTVDKETKAETVKEAAKEAGLITSDEPANSSYSSVFHATTPEEAQAADTQDWEKGTHAKAVGY